LALAVLLAGGAPAVEFNDATPDVAIATDAPPQGSSVLISTRSEPSETPPSTSLEPTSTISDVEPELAEPESTNTPPAASSAKAGKSVSPRVAALPNNGEAILSDVASDYARDNRPRPSRFHGVLPGESTRDDVLREWGEPAWASEARGDTSGGEVLRYDLKPFRRVEALVEGGVAQVIRVTLDERPGIDDLVGRLNLRKVDPVRVIDPASRELLGVAFPEKGLTLLTAPDDLGAETIVTHLVLQPLDPQAFALRAEGRAAEALSRKLADLERALELAPADAHALWLKAGVCRLAGDTAAAEAAAARAVELDDRNAAYRLRWSECLSDAGKHDKAVFEVRKVLDDTAAPALVRAQALAQMGELASLGEASIAQKSIGFLTASIDIADKLATSSDDAERHAAKDLLVEAHLAVTREIAKRDYGKKTDVVGEWIGRASGIAEERIASDGGGLELRLLVAREALAALAALRPAMDPAPWIKEAQEAADAVLASTQDKLYRQRIEWLLGEAHQEAVRIEHARGEADQALRYGGQAIEHLTAGAPPRAASIDAEATVGRLYFYLGAVNAVHKKNHEEAVGWYEKARPILTAEREPSDLVVPRRDGELLVSMSVSYWERGERATALDLTGRGAKLMERAVAAGVLEESALAVPYGNLASMHQQMGSIADATRYSNLARSVRSSATAPRAATASTTTQRPAARSAARVPSAADAERIATKRPTTKRGMAVAGKPQPGGTTVR
jgi:tetratricopeptide (TPR) repeat protein